MTSHACSPHRALPVATALGLAVSALGLSAGPLAGPATALEPAVTLYVAPAGASTTCASTQPCSLTTAQGKARTAAASGQDVTVVLAGGTYTMTAPLALTSADSALAGHVVRYQAAAGQTPVLSGGRTVTGWSQLRSSSTWVASAPGIAATRQLYVNGRRATLASAPVSAVFGTMTATSSGYATSRSGGLANWSSAADQPEIVFPRTPFPWTQSQCGITSAGNTSVAMASPCFQNLGDPGIDQHPDLTAATRTAIVQNNLALLTQPGQFYVNSKADKVYYMPRPGETMSTASVIAPQLASLVTGRDVANVTFSGITFTHTGWVPHPTQGLVEIQSNVFTASTNSTWSTIPAAVSFSGARNVTVSDSRLVDLGGEGLEFSNGGSNNAATGNVVSGVSSHGISLSSPIQTPEDGDRATNNYVHHVGLDYPGAQGIFAGAIARGTIAHNEVWATASSGITVGWGWGIETAMNQTHVDYNRVHDVNQRSLSDGGAIYLNGPNGGDSLNSTLSGNYVSGDPQPFGELYLDSGASSFRVTGNVVDRTSTNWLYLQVARHGTPAVDNAISGNYSDTSSAQCVAVSATCDPLDTIDASNTFDNNATDLTSWPAAATAIMAASGLEPAYDAITGGPVDTNLAWHTPATASSSSGAATPDGANDGASRTAWTSGGGTAWWQTDLGSPRVLSAVEVLTDQANLLPATLSNLRLVVSNSPISAASPGTTACALTGPGLAFQGTLTCPAPAGSWRYVGVIATGGQQLSLAEVRALGH